MLGVRGFWGGCAIEIGCASVGGAVSTWFLHGRPRITKEMFSTLMRGATQGTLFAAVSIALATVMVRKKVPTQQGDRISYRYPTPEERAGGVEYCCPATGFEGEGWIGRGEPDNPDASKLIPVYGARALIYLVCCSVVGIAAKRFPQFLGTPKEAVASLLMASAGQLAGSYLHAALTEHD